jgi:hypothetical protein
MRRIGWKALKKEGVGPVRPYSGGGPSAGGSAGAGSTAGSGSAGSGSGSAGAGSGVGSGLGSTGGSLTGFSSSGLTRSPKASGYFNPWAPAPPGWAARAGS